MKIVMRISRLMHSLGTLPENSADGLRQYCAIIGAEKHGDLTLIGTGFIHSKQKLGWFKPEYAPGDYHLTQLDERTQGPEITAGLHDDCGATLMVDADTIILEIGRNTRLSFRDRSELLFFLKQCRSIQEFLLAAPEEEEDE